ncbi:MAG: hypothetical protein CM15mP49_35760 [Actinomycetota bacterium]|nr:MAG: hypothetical protein CM15mP49_35760 [Actinomycetota bacterium]
MKSAQDFSSQWDYNILRSLRVRWIDVSCVLDSPQQNGFMIINEGWEYVFILAHLGITVAMIGPGNWSIDHKIGWDNELDGYAGLLISAGGGILAATHTTWHLLPSTERRASVVTYLRFSSRISNATLIAPFGPASAA